MSGTAKFSLDSRLALCASLVRGGARLADIGTDHALLPIWLCLEGICPRAIAADIRPDPLKSGRENINKYGLDGKIETRLSNGLEKISEDEADDIVIAGMGGELIAKIIDNWRFSKNKDKHFILQPMTKGEELVRYLFENGFEILKRDCRVCSGKCYNVILCAYTGKITEYDEAELYAYGLDPKTDPLHRRFIEDCIKRLNKQANGDPKHGETAGKLENTL